MDDVFERCGCMGFGKGVEVVVGVNKLEYRGGIHCLLGAFFFFNNSAHLSSRDWSSLTFTEVKIEGSNGIRGSPRQ